MAAVVLLCAATPNNVPEEVAAHIRDMADTCRQVKGKPLSDPTVEHGNLAQGLAFWVIDEDTFKCDGAASLFSGSRGSDLLVYVSMPDGHAKQAFTTGGYGITVERAGDFSRIWIEVGGRLCGQKGDPTTAELISCERSLNWDAKTQKLDFAPLSEARTPHRSASLAVPEQSAKTPIEDISYDSGAELDNPKTYVFQTYWSDTANRLNWKRPLAERGKIYNGSLVSADGRRAFVTMLQSPSVCDPLCPVRIFTGQQRKIMDILACGDRTQHGVSLDHTSFVACGKAFPIPQVDARTALLENTPPGSDPDAYAEVQRSKPAHATEPVYVDSASHNNSQVLVSEWKDGTVEITYDAPRAGLPVAQGTVLFRGVRNGTRYSGSAYTFKAGCPPAAYAVTGAKDAKKDLIVLTGAVPRRDPQSCEAIGASTQSSQAKLVFDTKFYGDE